MSSIVVLTKQAPCGKVTVGGKRMPNVKITKLKCKQCGHEWAPRTADVRVCPNPKCHSVYWDRQPHIVKKDAR